MNRQLYWRQLLFPGPVSPDSVRAVLVGLAGLPGGPRLVLEATATAGRVRWRIGAESDLNLRQACHQVKVHLIGVVITPIKGGWPAVGVDLSQPVAAGQVKIRRSRLLPLSNDDPDITVRGLLGALAEAGKNEVLLYQLLLGTRQVPSRPPEGIRAPAREAVARFGQAGFGCVIRIAASAGHPARARQLVRGIGASLRRLEAPGITIRVRGVSLAKLTPVTVPLWWPLWVSAGDLVPLTAWPVADDPGVRLPGTPPPHPRLLSPAAEHPQEGVVVGKAMIGATDRAIAQPVGDTFQHRHLMGSTGVGKSTVSGNLALQDIWAGRGVTVIDPKRDLITDLLARIPKHRLDDVVLLDSASRTPLGVNPLTGADPDLAADSVVAVFHSMYGDGLGPRSTDILHAAVLTLARRGDASLPMVPLLLTNPGFRRSVVGRTHKEDPLGLGAFWAWFESLKPPEQDTVTRPLLNKLRPIMMRPSLRGIFGQRRPAISIEQILAERKILLVALRKDQIGVEAATLLGSHVVSLAWRAILGRISLPAEARHPMSVYIDEVQDYLRLPGSLADALAQARALGVSITAAHQHLGQLGSLAADLEANTATKLFFRLSPADARHWASAAGGKQLTADDFALQPDHQLYARLLAHGQLLPWVSVASQPLPPPLHDPATVQARSEARYGRALDTVDADLLSLADQTTPTTGSNSNDRGVSADTRQPSTGFGRRRPPTTPPPSNQKGGTP